MMDKIKVVQIGCGKMSKYTMRYVYEKGGLVVGAVDINPEIIGKDIGFIMGMDEKNVKVDSLDHLQTLLSTVKPDVAIITTMSVLNDIADVARICLKEKVNVITTCEEAFFASNSNPSLYRELDILAKANGVTMMGCGYQDVFWGNMISTICGSTHRITKIKGSSFYNVEDYGIALAQAHGAGFTVEQFEEEIASINKMSKEEQQSLMKNRAFFPSYMWNVVGWLADKLQFHITEIKQKCIPILCEEELYSDTLNITLEKGQVRGMSAVVTAETLEGILFEVECIGKVYTKEESDQNKWTVFGEPTTTVVNELPQTVELTCADIVNRIPDVLKAKSGFLSSSELNSPKYIVKFFE